MTNDLSSNEQDQRRSDRKALSEVVTVLDGVTGDRMGQIGNLSTEGLMLITRNDVETDSLFQLNFTLVGPDDQAHDFNIGAVCIWCSPASSTNSYWAGFVIMDISEQDGKFFRDTVLTL